MRCSSLPELVVPGAGRESFPAVPANPRLHTRTRRGRWDFTAVARFDGLEQLLRRVAEVDPYHGVCVTQVIRHVRQRKVLTDQFTSAPHPARVGPGQLAIHVDENMSETLQVRWDQRIPHTAEVRGLEVAAASR